jgi:hypothetical protein
VPSLAELFNSPSDLVFEGKTYRLRQPNQLEKGEFQAWIEQLALDGILRQKAPPDIIDRQLNGLTRDKTKGVYAWGGDVCCDKLTTEEGLAKFLAIVLRDQEVTLELARRMAEQEFKRIVFGLFPQETDEQKKVAEAVASVLGLNGSSSSSA